MTNSELTTYGECPRCGEMCQPDFVLLTEKMWEFTLCCDCRIGWYYYRQNPDIRESHHRVWKPEDIETFEEIGYTPYECEERDG
jgi:hypothetical protein